MFGSRCRTLSDGRREGSIRFVISAPSGAGKTTLATELLGRVDGLTRTISCTTRDSRRGERDGRDYFFIDAEEFGRRVEADAFLEWAEVHGHRYGTLRAEIDRIEAAGDDAVMVIDVQGAAAVKEALDDAVTVFVLPPSRRVLEERLLGRRGSHDQADESLSRRLDVAAHEIDRYLGYDYVVVNDDFETAVAELVAIVRAERCRRPRRAAVAEEILESFRDADASGPSIPAADAIKEDTP